MNEKKEEPEKFADYIKFKITDKDVIAKLTVYCVAFPYPFESLDELKTRMVGMCESHI